MTTTNTEGEGEATFEMVEKAYFARLRRENLMTTEEENAIAVLLENADEAFQAAYEADATWVAADASWTKAKAEAEETIRARSRQRVTMTESESAVHCDNYWDRRFTNEDKRGTP